MRKSLNYVSSLFFVAHAASAHTLFPVCDPGADRILRSSDGTLFKVFSRDLKMYSGAFPSPKVTIPGITEILRLPESARVLELLFQFMRRQRQPDIKHMAFGVLASLAEAVEKYEVYSAIEVCKVHMTYVTLFLPFRRCMISTSITGSARFTEVSHGNSRICHKTWLPRCQGPCRSAEYRFIFSSSPEAPRD